jgi:predicted PurR-regulated permease PerM
MATIKQLYNIEFSFDQIIKIIAIIGLALLIYRLTDTLLIIFLAFIIMAASKPAASYLREKLKLSEAISVISVFVIILTIIISAVFLISQPLASEVARFAESAPTLSENLVNWLAASPIVTSYIPEDQLSATFEQFYRGIANQFTSFANIIGETLLNAFQGVIQAVFILVFSIYLYLERESIKDYLVRLFKLKRKKFDKIYNRVEIQLGAWVRGQLILGLVVGIFTYIGLVILGIKYALPLAIIAGILEIIPIIGPIITGIILTIVGLSISPLTGFFALILSIAIQQLENNLLVPYIMKKAVGLSPVLTIISILIGQELFGILGAIMAVPTAATLAVILNTYLDHRDKIKHAHLEE